VQTDISYFLFFEFPERGSLRDIMRNEKIYGFAEFECIKIGLNVLGGLEFLHSKGIVHSDVKPDNVMVMSDWTVKLGGFDKMKKLKNPEREERFLIGNSANHTTSEIIHKRTPGDSANYMAPEMIQDRAYGSKADIYSFGCMMLELLDFENPNDIWDSSLTKESKQTTEAFLNHRCEAKLSVPIPLCLLMWNQESVNSLSRCVAFDPEERPSARITRFHLGCGRNFKLF